MSMTFTIARRMDDGAWWHGDHDAAFNVHNAGGCAILASLGFETDYCGTLDAAEVLRRCVTFRAVDAPARGTVEPAVHTGAGATMVECGFDVEYVRERIGRLEALARIAVAEGAAVGWS
jgi:hypothetical protein